jgi:NAD+ synthase (glutamine-hydrolysing)
MRIAIAQINPLLGDIKNNEEKINEYIKRAISKKAELIIFSESSLLGYHPFDLLERSELVDSLNKALKRIQKKVPEGVGIILGTITRNQNKQGRPYYNSAALVQKNKIQYFHKQLLPTGDVFDEARFIESGKLENNYFKFKGRPFFLTICEDIWAWPDSKGISSYAKNPLQQIKLKKVDLVINLSASPWFIGKEKLRQSVAWQTAKRFKAPILYTNLVGAQDEIIFDGESFIITPEGKRILQCNKFVEELNVFDLNTRQAWATARQDQPIEQLRKALVLGIRDFCQKIGINQVHLGLSGGIDSTLVACLAVDALGPGSVKAIYLPGPHSSPLSEELSQKLAKNLGLKYQSVSINSAYDLLANIFSEKLGALNFGVPQENLQSRLRGLMLMGISNIENSLLLTTGNKSEYATGYCTLYGDMCGGLAPLGDLTKDLIYQLANHYNVQHEIIPKLIIERPPTAELRPNQKDQDSLPDYEILDKAVVNIVEKGKRANGKTEKWLIRQLVKTEFKRWQAPPILKVTSHSFGRGRRWPLAHKAFLD